MWKKNVSYPVRLWHLPDDMLITFMEDGFLAREALFEITQLEGTDEYELFRVSKLAAGIDKDFLEWFFEGDRKVEIAKRKNWYNIKIFY